MKTIDKQNQKFNKNREIIIREPKRNYGAKKYNE